MYSYFPLKDIIEINHELIMAYPNQAVQNPSFSIQLKKSYQNYDFVLIQPYLNSNPTVHGCFYIQELNIYIPVQDPTQCFPVLVDMFQKNVNQITLKFIEQSQYSATGQSAYDNFTQLNADTSAITIQINLSFIKLKHDTNQQSIQQR